MTAHRSLVVGSTGLVGEEVVNELASKGIPVIALSRIDLNSPNPLVENIKGKIAFSNYLLGKDSKNAVGKLKNVCLGRWLHKYGKLFKFAN